METLGPEIIGCLPKFSDESLGRHLPLVRREDTPEAAVCQLGARWRQHDTRG